MSASCWGGELDHAWVVCGRIPCFCCRAVGCLAVSLARTSGRGARGGGRGALPTAKVSLCFTYRPADPCVVFPLPHLYFLVFDCAPYTWSPPYISDFVVFSRLPVVFLPSPSFASYRPLPPPHSLLAFATMPRQLSIYTVSRQASLQELHLAIFQGDTARVRMYTGYGSWRAEAAASHPYPSPHARSPHSQRHPRPQLHSHRHGLISWAGAIFFFSSYRSPAYSCCIRRLICSVQVGERQERHVTVGNPSARCS